MSDLISVLPHLGAYDFSTRDTDCMKCESKRDKMYTRQRLVVQPVLSHAKPLLAHDLVTSNKNKEISQFSIYSPKNSKMEIS